MMVGIEDIIFYVGVITNLREDFPELVLTESFSVFPKTVEEIQEKYQESLDRLGLKVKRIAKVRLKELKDENKE
jgi:hypothetical protein